MPVRRILQLGDAMLRQASLPVTSLGEAAGVVADLRDTLHEFRGTHGFGRGISAVQIGEPLRIIYIELDGVPLSIFNPVLESMSEERIRLWDDCFSFPDLLVQVERSASVTLHYLDPVGVPNTLRASGALSELLQHEMDHLDGILAIDRAMDRSSFRTKAEHERQNAVSSLRS
jgi:peptide deformylase